MPAILNTNTTISQINIATQKATVKAKYQAMITGVESDLKDLDSFSLNQVTMPKAMLIARLQARVDAAEKTLSDRTALHASVAAERALDKEVTPLRTALKQFLQSRYGKNSAELQKFGFTPAKVPQRAAATKATAVANSKATRAARSTKGKKQKSTIKGTATATANAPAHVASAPPTTPATPATATPSAPTPTR